MKKVFLALLLTTSFAFANKVEKGTETVYNDSKEAVSTIYKDAKSLAPKIEDSIKSIAKGLKVGAESVWDILVKQQLVWSICFLILTLMSLINWHIFYKKNISDLKYEKGIVKVQKLLHREGATEHNELSYPATYARRWQTIEEEGLIEVPKYSNPVFKYIHLCVCITLSVFSFINFPDMLTGFINPEFGAMKNIAELALQLK